MKTITAMILAAALLFGAAAPATASSTEIRTVSVEYEHCDEKAFDSRAQRLYALADSGAAAAASALYDELYNELTRIDTMSVLAMLGHYGDIHDAYWSEEYAYTARLLNEAGDSLSAAAAYMLESPCKDSFSAHIGPDATEFYLSYEPMTPEQADDYDRELALIDEYYALTDDIGSTETQFGGETWTYDDLRGDAGNDLATWDYGSYTALYDRMQEALTERFAPIFIELVQLRTRLARSRGYESYADYAYENVYYRAYTVDEAQALCDRIRPVAREYNDALAYSDLQYSYKEAKPVMDTQDLLAVLEEYLPRVAPSLSEPLSFMRENDLSDLAPAAEGRVDGAFTAELSYYGCPYIFGTLEDSCYDLSTLTHEYGHFTNFYLNPTPDWFIYEDDLDLSEIHSNGLQALFTHFYEDIYDEGADAAEFSNLSFLLENVIDGCLFDEFQRRAYARADELDAGLLNEIFKQLCEEYGAYSGYEFSPEWDAGWIYISHNFEAPFYYISYAVSALSAIALWAQSQIDFQTAAGEYLELLGHGAHDEGYFQVLEACGMKPFTAEDSEQPCFILIDRLRALDHARYWG